jgi:peptide/nickel transport system substrate-binding protein
LIALSIATQWAGVAKAAEPGTLVVGMYRPTLTLNQALNPDYTTTLPGSQIFASLLRFDAKGQPQPYLAKSWSWSADQKALTLKLVENGLFHDGTPITSKDVKFSLLTVKGLAGKTSKLNQITEIRTPDATTVVVQLDRPAPSILLALSSPFLPVMPEHVYGQGNIRTNPANTIGAVGSGPFKLVEFKAGQYVTLERFDKFFLGQPKLQRIVFKAGADLQTLVLGLERGEIDAIPYMYDWRLVKRLSADARFTVTDEGYAGIGPLNNLMFNLRHKPLDDVRVRKAIAYAMDRPFIAKVLLGGTTTVAYSPLAPTTPYYTDKVETYPTDLKKAAALLDEAGLKVGPDGMRFKLTIYYPPGNVDYHKNGAEYTRSQLRKVGIDVDVRSTDFVSWLKALATGDFDMSMISLFNFGDPAFGVTPQYSSTNIQPLPYANNANYRNPVVDDLLEAGSVETDPVKRERIYAQFQKIAMDELPILPLTVLKFHTVTRKGLLGLPAGFWGTAAPYNDVRWSPESGR